MPLASSLVARSVLAIVLMVLCYALTVGMLAALGWAGVWLFQTAAVVGGRGAILLVIFGLACFGTAAVVAWSVLPRSDRFVPPGPEITAEQHPLLFVELRRIATATGQPMPAHVYLAPDVNAFVAQRGGWMGIGSRRVMGIGLPLMRVLSADELCAVLAHEMGHFYGGDTRLGPWIYKTRAALIRTVVNLQHAHAAEQWIAVPFLAIHALFRWLLIGFLRVSQAISRAQEHSADAVAVRAVGRRALIEGLKKTHAASLAHPVYMRSEVAPLLSRGRLPAIGEGFTRFLSSERLARVLDEALAHELAEGSADPFDSHPPLRERIEAVSAIAGPTRPPDARGAIELLQGADALEAADLRARAGRRLEPIAWSDTAPVWTRIWRDELRETGKALAGLRVGDVPGELREIYPRVVRAIGEDRARDAGDDELRAWWGHVVGQALAVLLLEAGFTAITAPGEPDRLALGDETIEPLVEAGRHARGEETADAWRARWEARGLADRELVASRRDRA